MAIHRVMSRDVGRETFEIGDGPAPWPTRTNGFTSVAGQNIRIHLDRVRFLEELNDVLQIAQ
jgi:hypothetical protein